MRDWGRAQEVDRWALGMTMYASDVDQATASIARALSQALFDKSCPNP
jgi:hypothetical protein